MATRTMTVMSDDLDGSVATQTVRFALDQKQYEVDLNERNAAALRTTLDKFVAVARKAGGASTGSVARRRASTSTSDYDPHAVRSWARANGIEVSPRGRISGEVLAKFRAAGN